MKHVRRMICMAIAAVMMLAVPVWGDSTERDYTADAKVWFEMSRLNQRIPEKYLPYFEDMLSLPEDEFAHLRIANVCYNEEVNGVKVWLDGSGEVMIPSKDGSVINARGETYICSMIVDRETGEPISARKISEEVSRHKGINADICITLPEDFDMQKHSLIFFFYVIVPTYPSKYHLEYEYYISNPVEADISHSLLRGDGDVNSDGKVNLLDVSDTLKYIAEWEISGFDCVRSDTDANGIVNLTDAGIILRRIAGFVGDWYYTEYYIKDYSEAADTLYSKRREELLKELVQRKPDYSYEYISSYEMKTILSGHAHEYRILEVSPEEFEMILEHNKDFFEFVCERYGWEMDYLISFMSEAYNSAE